MKQKAIFVACVAALGMGSAMAADPAKINWSKIKPTTIPLFYPGVSSYQWLRSEAHKGAFEETRRGDSCVSCHDEEDGEKYAGENIVKGGKGLEPKPVKNKNGFVPLKVQAAYDEQNAYLRFQWPTANPYPGVEHQYLRFDGNEWKVWGYPKLNLPVQEGKEQAIYEDRLSLMIDDGKVPMFAEQGCWLTCHDGQRDMPNLATRDQVANNPLFKEIKKNDVRKYLPATRTDPMDWKTGKPLAEIKKLKAEGYFVDLVQWRGHRSNSIGMADDGYVLEWRNFDAGTNIFASNKDNKTGLPKFMYDEKKVGYKAVNVSELRKRDNPALVKEKNGAPFDPNAGWKPGDMVPYYMVSAEDAKGSTTDNKAVATWKDGTWTVVITRPLNLKNDDDKALSPGKVYNVGFAVHDDNITTRGHHVSWVKTLGFGVKADIQAVKLK